MKKRIVSIILAVVMIASMLSISAITAFAEEAEYTVTVQGENYYEIQVWDSVSNDTHYINPGESCTVTPNSNYEIYARYDNTAYELKDLGDWQVDPDTDELYLTITAGEAGESTTVTAPELKNIKTVKIYLDTGSGYSTVEVTATDSNGTRVVPFIPGESGSYFVKVGDTVKISAEFSSKYYYISSATERWEINNNHVEYSFIAGNENPMVSLPKLTSYSGFTEYTVTIVGDNYSYFNFCGIAECNSGTTLTRSVTQPYDIMAVYDKTAYRYEDLGDWILNPDGNLYYFSVGVVTEKQITITAPTLIPRKYTVTVQGENYLDFDVFDIAKGDAYRLKSGESCVVTSNSDYVIYADYDDTAYELEDLGDWEIDPYSAGVLFIDLTAGETGESTTVTAPVLIAKKVTKYDCNGDGEINAQDLIVLQQALLTDSEYSEVLDCNGDGILDIRDLVRMKKYLADHSVPLGKKESNSKSEQIATKVANVHGEKENV